MRLEIFAESLEELYLNKKRDEKDKSTLPSSPEILSSVRAKFEKQGFPIV